MGERRYTEKEAAQIIRRAAEIQDQAGAPAGAGGGSSLADLHRIAAEVGIDPAHVEAALAEGEWSLASAEHGAQSRLLGAPPEYSVEKLIPGRLTPELWQTLVGALNMEYQQSEPGTVSGAIHTWRWKHDLGWVHFSAIQTPAGVKAKLNLHMDSGLIAGLIPTVVAWFALASVLFASDALRPWLSALLSALALAVLALAFRASAASWWAKDRKKSAALMERLADLAATASPLPALGVLEEEEELQARLSPDPAS